MAIKWFRWTRSEHGPIIDITSQLKLTLTCVTNSKKYYYLFALANPQTEQTDEKEKKKRSVRVRECLECLELFGKFSFLNFLLSTSNVCAHLFLIHFRVHFPNAGRCVLCVSSVSVNEWSQAARVFTRRDTMMSKQWDDQPKSHSWDSLLCACA